MSITHTKNPNQTFSQQKQEAITQPINMNRTAAIILGGGQGTRLFPLTLWRCKPAICFGGRYRLIDIPISNAINSGCQKIFVVTQFLSSSLHRHIFNTYQFDRFNRSYIELLPAEERPSEQAWFQGTADAVRKNIDYFINAPVDYFLILSGDQMYHMDFTKMLAQAQITNADLTLAAMPVSDRQSKRMGILKVNEDGFITTFREKPQADSELEDLRTNRSLLEALGAEKSQTNTLLGSLGIYLFKRQALLDLLAQDTREDFGKHLLPTQVARGNIAAFIHNTYWEDIGTIESFYNANMMLTKPTPDFDLYNEEFPIFTAQENLPSPKIADTHITNAIIAEGSQIEADEIKNSIVGRRTHIQKGTIVQDSYIMGNDFYSPRIHTGRLPETLKIGENCLIRKAILDKHVSIGNRVQLVNKGNLTSYDSPQVYIRDGIIVVPQGTTLPDGFVL